MQAYIQSFSNIFIPYRNLIPSKKFTMIGVREGVVAIEDIKEAYKVHGSRLMVNGLRLMILLCERIFSL